MVIDSEWECSSSPVAFSNTNNDKQLLFPAMCVCVSVSLCECAEPLNFAADQAEMENFHGLEKTAAREMGSETEKWGEDG